MEEVRNPVPAPSPVDLPYFDRLLARLDDGDPDVSRAFGRHVHWGYWPDPRAARCTPDDYAQAAERLTSEVCEAAGARDGERILDAGCGFGGTLAFLNERLHGVELTGLNVDERQLERARATVAAREANSVRFEPGDACELPFADGSFDVVLAVESIFHFRDRRRFFAEASRVLRPGGRLALSDFVPAHWGGIKTRTVFGPISVRCTLAGYRQLAAETRFEPRVERDVTAHTMPTYRFLRRLERTAADQDRAARVQTAVLDWISRLRLLRYVILSYAVAERSDG